MERQGNPALRDLESCIPSRLRHLGGDRATSPTNPLWIRSTKGVEGVTARIESFVSVMVLTVAVLLVVDAPNLGLQDPEQPVKNSRCDDPQHHQFDFWTGDWDVNDVGGVTRVARVKVSSILDGCVLLENYEGADGHKGQSFSIYDSSRKVWHQTWVTNHGELLEIEGNLDGKAMVLSGSEHPSANETKLVRGAWKPVSEGVRETAVISVDGGKSWKPWFDLIFRPH